jgi:small subunit ribosomal protein S15
MARMHTRKKGKSRSKKPSTKVAPEWVEYSPAEVEDLVEKLMKEGHTPALVGLVLRDQYGIPSVKNSTGKTVTKIMKEKGAKIEYPEDFLNLVKRSVSMRKQTTKNKKDYFNKTRLNRVESKIKRLVIYYKKKGVLPEGWKYNAEQAALLVK